MSWIARAWDKFRSAAADAGDPGRAARIDHAASLIWRELRTQRGRFDLNCSPVASCLAAADRLDACALVYRRCCVRASEDGRLTQEEQEQLAFISAKLGLGAADVDAVERLAQVPRVVDHATGEIVQHPRMLTPPPPPPGLVAPTPLPEIKWPCVPGPEDDRPRVKPLIAAGIEAARLQLFAFAAQQRICVSLYYDKGDGDASVRIVEPCEALTYRKSPMLRSWQVDPPVRSPSWRTFRLDRILEADLVSSRAVNVRAAPIAAMRARTWSPAEIEDEEW